jgi:glutamate-1-semialdehyde 2,1-aminomutase
MFGFFFSEQPITCFEDAAKYADADRFAKYHRMMLERGVYLAPSMYEAGFTSLAHTEEQVDKTIEAVRAVFSQL